MMKLKGEIKQYGLFWLTVIMVFLAGFAASRALADRPNYVYDWEDLLTDVEEIEIETFCLEVDKNTTVEIVVITLKSFDEPLKVGDIDEAKVKYFNEYALDGVKGIGKEGEDNGILLIFSMNEGDWGIEVGYGVEGDLTDSESGRIGRNVLVPLLLEDEYGDAVLQTVQAIAAEVGYGSEDVVILPSDELTLGDIPLWMWAIAIVIVLALLWFLDVGGGSYSSGGSGRGGWGGSSGGGGGFGGGGSGGGGASGGIRG